MTRRAHALLCFVVAASLAACRAIVGIEDLEVADAGASEAGAVDGNAGDARADASSVPDAVAAQIASCVAQDCRRCCKSAFPALKDLEASSATRGCVCQPGSRCETECSDGYCGGGPPSPSCVPCVDDKFSGGECTAECKTAECQAGLTCMRACPAGP